MMRLARALFILAGLACTTDASAQQFPSKSLTLIVPFAAGGPVDVTARLIGDHMARTLGQPVVLENVGGAGGSTGTTRVARSTPDGHTLLIHQPALAFSGALYPNLGYDPVKDFAPVAMLNHTSIIIVARNTLPAKNVVDLKAYGATNPISFAHAGVGSMAHLCASMFSLTLGIKANLVAYRGGGPALNDIAAGHVDLFCSSTQTAKPLINGGTMFGMGVTSTEASRTTPPAPPLIGHPLFGKAMDFDFWMLMAAPKATPPAVMQKLNAAVRQAITDPELARKFTDTDVLLYPPEQMTPQYAEKLLASEIERWTSSSRTTTSLRTDADASATGTRHACRHRQSCPIAFRDDAPRWHSVRALPARGRCPGAASRRSAGEARRAGFRLEAGRGHAAGDTWTGPRGPPALLIRARLHGRSPRVRRSASATSSRLRPAIQV